MNRLLLGGWTDVLEDVRRLNLALRAVPDECRCGHGQGHLAGTCACCAEGTRACADCNVLIDGLRAKVDELTDAALRFLPFVEVESARSDTHGEIAARIRNVRGQTHRLDAVFLQIETAAGEYRAGCAASHMAALKRLTAELLERTQETNTALTALVGGGRAAAERQ